MRDTIRALAAEWLKMKRRRTTWILPVLLLLATVVVYFTVYHATERQWIGEPEGFNITAAALHVMLSLLQLLVVIVTCFLIAREFSWGTVESTWVRPLGRGSWYVGKLITAGVAAGVMFLICVVTVTALTYLTVGYGDLTEQEYLVHAAGDLGWRLALTVLLTLWGLWAVAGVTALVSAIFGHPGGALATVLGLGLAMTVLSIYPATAPFLLSSQVTSPMEQMIAMSKGVPLPYAWDTLIWRTLVGAGVWMGLAVAAGVMLVRRKEINR